MSRSFGDNLSKEDIKTIADVRRDVWTSGFKGLGFGAAAGYIMHAASRAVYNSLSSKSMGKIRIPGSDKPLRFSRNSAFFSVMAGGALGSFILATTTGKNEVHQMHDIFQIGKHEYKTPYQKAYENLRTEEDDAESRRRRRLSRRKTVSKRLLERQGLNDSHGGKWVTEEIESEQRSRRSRRQVAMSKRFEEE